MLVQDVSKGGLCIQPASMIRKRARVLRAFSKSAPLGPSIDAIPGTRSLDPRAHEVCVGDTIWGSCDGLLCMHGNYMDINEGSRYAMFGLQMSTD